jgi:hypothetical protein
MGLCPNRRDPGDWAVRGKGPHQSRRRSDARRSVLVLDELTRTVDAMVDLAVDHDPT